MSDDLNGAEALDLDNTDEPDETLERAAYVRDVILARCGDVLTVDDLADLADADLALTASAEPGGDEMIPLEVADQILDVVLALDERMAKLEAAVHVGNATVDQVWRLMADMTVDQKADMLDKLEGLVAMEEASHAPIQ